MKTAKPSGVTISFTTEELVELSLVMHNLVVDWHKDHAGALDHARFKILQAADTIKHIENIAGTVDLEPVSDDVA